MCGIVGVASSNKVSMATLDLFKSLLLHDVVRGHHATGVAAINTFKNEVGVSKEAIPSYEFLSKYDIDDSCNIYIGHNRWATRGDKTKDENAHPFSHGSITGVHNGSLRNQSLLDDHTDFEVDSDNLFNHLSRNGIEHTTKNLDGAFAIVYYDTKDRTLNFIRNSERPLYICKLGNGSIAWASEELMLEWLVTRSKTLSFKKHEGKDMIYSLGVGIHYKIQFSGYKMKEQQSVKQELHTPRAVNYGTVNYGNTTWDSKLLAAIKAVNSFADRNSWFEVKTVGGSGNKKTLEYTNPQGQKWVFISYSAGNLPDGVCWVKITGAYAPTQYDQDKALVNRNDLVYMAGTVAGVRPAGAVFSSNRPPAEARVVLANDRCTLDELRGYRFENKEICSNCAEKIHKTWPAKLYLLQHFDREANEKFNYLSCSKACHEQMVEFVAEIESDYAQQLEGINI